MKVKNPTYRKLKNRGITPLLYHSDHGQYAVWIEKEGPKWMTVRYVDGTRKRLPKSEGRYMKPLVDRHGTGSAVA